MDTPDRSHEGVRPDEFAPGTVLADRYRIESLVGRGGAGVVYRARQIGLDRDVAIKVLRSGYAFSTLEIERFRREAIATGRLHHPNIVTVHDFGTLPDHRAFLVLEYLRGPALDTWLAARGPVSPEITVGILAQVCAAVDAAHAQGIVHRDIKPSNIILPDDKDAGGHVKVVDFGIARLGEGSTSITGEAIPGTPAYIAPEVIEGNPAGPAADIYAIGMLVYEMLTGRAPFAAQTSTALLYLHLTKVPDPPSALVPALPPALDAVVLKALEKMPSRRYESARELADAFADALHGRRRALTVEAGKDEKPCVLVVDDDEVVLKLVQAALRGDGYATALASDGIDALLRLGSQRFDLIISDIEMPNLDGFRLLEVVSTKKIHTPVIFLTGHEGDDREVRGFEMGAADFIRKPIAPGVLLARVRRVLGR